MHHDCFGNSFRITKLKTIQNLFKFVKIFITESELPRSYAYVHRYEPPIEN